MRGLSQLPRSTASALLRISSIHAYIAPMTARIFWVGLICTALVWTGCQHTQPSTESSTSPSGPTVLARYADQTITLDEFERRYARSVGDSAQAAADSMAAYREFLDRYVDFRLKVHAAREAGMDTLDSYQQEVRSYQQQMARPRLLRREVMDPLIRTLYDRRQHEVNVSHILIRVAPEAPPADTLQAYQKLASIVDSLNRGADFGMLAARHSEDPSAQRQGAPGYRGQLGFLTAGRTVKAFEDRMYSTPEGAMSDIFRTRFGYHVLKVHERRPARPNIDIAHIMIRPEGGTPSDTADARQRALALQDSLDAGADFAALARQHSDDAQSAQRGGQLGTISSDRPLPASFKEAAFAIDSVGAVSPVVQTRFGFHLIKLLDRQAQPSYEEAYDDLKELASRLPRSNAAQQHYAREVRNRIGARVDTAQVLEALDIEALSAPVDQLSGTESSARAVTLGDSTYTLSEVASFAPPQGSEPNTTVGARIDAFLNDAAITHAATRLEERDPEFRLMMNEYRDGLLLFQFMQDSVWTAAANNTAALRAHFQSNREDYRLPERVAVAAFRSPADSLLEPIAASLRSRPTADSAIARAERTQPVRADTVMVPLQPDTTRSSLYRRALKVNEGEVVGPLPDENQYVLLVRGPKHPARLQTFEEARNAVVQDYQEVYEEAVLDRLHRQHNVRMYPERLQRAFGRSSTESVSARR